jgi:L-ascorbate metabolism protein UlaG (beta-lactamase superfamily)
MRVTKYPQSCLKIEHDGQTLLIDVGTLATAEYAISDFGEFDAVLYTHSHPDHFDVAVLPQLAATGAILYGNANVAELAGDTAVEIIEAGEELVVAGCKIKVFAFPHCLMVDGSEAGIPNNGFLINDHLLLPGDSTEVGSLKAPAVALPIFGPDISMHDAYTLAASLEAQVAIPVHYDVAGMKPGLFAHFVKVTGATLKTQVHSLKNGESIEL